MVSISLNDLAAMSLDNPIEAKILEHFRTCFLDYSENVSEKYWEMTSLAIVQEILASGEDVEDQVLEHLADVIDDDFYKYAESIVYVEYDEPGMAHSGGNGIYKLAGLYYLRGSDYIEGPDDLKVLLRYLDWENPNHKVDFSDDFEELLRESKDPF